MLCYSFTFYNLPLYLTSTNVPFTSTIDRIAGTLTANIPAFVPTNMIVDQDVSIHFKIDSTGREIDFENETFVKDAPAAV